MARKTQTVILLVLATALFFTSPVFCQEDLVKVKISDFSGGQNTYDLDDIISANQGVLLQNVVVSKKGQLIKRRGQALFSDDLSNSPFYGIGDFYPDTTTSYMLVASGSSVIRTTPAGTSWVTLNLNAVEQLTPNKDTEFVQANNRVFAFNGQDDTPIYNGTTWDGGGDWPASPPIGTTAVWLNNYLFVGGNPVYGDWIYVSNNLDPMTWTITDIVYANTGDGQRIIKLEPFRLNELVVYKERSIYVLDVTDPTFANWTLQPLTRSIGCLAPRSVVNIGNDQWFLSSEPFAVRSLIRTSFDKILLDMASQQIQDIFDGTGDDVRINATYIRDACAVLYDNKYFLAICTGSATYNNFVVIYDFITKAWSTIDNWAPAAWLEYNDNLYYIDALDGRVVQCFTGTVGDLASGPIVTPTTSTVPITFTYISKNIDFDNAENYKECDALEVMFEPSGSYVATIYIELDDSGWQEVGTINLSGDAVTLPVDLPFDLTASGLARETFQIQQYGEFRKIKVKIVQAGLSELCNLHSFTVFARIKPWRRE